jgi:HYDIN/CFA65/VesB family protein
MLYLENLEPRCLLSVTITDSIGDDSDAYMPFDQTMVGDQSVREEIEIAVSGDHPGDVTVTEIRIEDDQGELSDNFMVVLPADLEISPGETLTIPVYFTPLAAGELRESLIIETGPDNLPYQISLFGIGQDVQIIPPDSSTLNFYSGVGQIDQNFIQIIYADGLEDPLVISDIQVSGSPSFSIGQPAPPQSLPGAYYFGYYYGTPNYTADEVETLYVNDVPKVFTVGTETDAFGVDVIDYYDVYSFQAQAGQMVDVRALLENSGSLTVTAYTNSGIELTSDTATSSLLVSEFTSAPFPAPYTGIYYAEVYGISAVDPDTYEIMVTSTTATLPEVLLTEDPLDPNYVPYEGLIGNPLILEAQTQWLQFDAEFGDEIDFQFEVNSPFAFSPPTIFDKRGRPIQTDLTLANDYPDMEGDGYTLLNDGPYYIQVTEPGSLEQFEYEITIVELGSMLELESGERLNLPVYFRPDSLGTFSGSIEFNMSSPVVDHAQYTLHGESYPGDLALDEVTILNLQEYIYDDTAYAYAQSGEPLEVVATITNTMDADIQQSADLVYYLSTDQIYGNSDDIRLTPALQSLPLFSNHSVVVSGSVNIPDGLEGEYYLLAIVDPFNQVPEIQEPNLPFFVDPMVVEDELTPVIEPLILAPENLLVTDSVDDPFDRVIDYGERPLNTFNTEYVWLLNRGPTPVTVTSYSLETGDVFQFPDPGSPAFQAPPILIMSDQTGNIPVIFAPEAFPLSGEEIITDTLTVQTSEGKTYVFDLTAEFAGANLIVLESSGTGTNDNQMDLGTVRVGQASTPAPFTLVNLGDQPLYINDIDFGSANFTAFDYILTGGGSLPIILDPFGDPNNGNQAEFLLTFAPNHTGAFVDTLIIHSSDTTGDYTVQLAGNGVSPALVVEESQGLPNDNYLPFGWHAVDEPDSTEIILSNAGTDALAIQGWQFQNAIVNDFAVDIDNDPAVSQDDLILQPGQSQTLTVTFLAAAEGSFNDSLIIYSDDGQHLINLSSLAGQSALPSLEFLYDGDLYGSLALDIGNVFQGQSLSEVFYVVNNGFVELTVDSISVEGAGFSLFDTGITQPKLLQAGEKHQVLVKFDADPNLPIELYQGSIVVSSSAPEMVVPISSAIVIPEIDLSDMVLDFGATDESQPVSLDLDIANSGNTNLVITDWSVQDPQFVVDVPPQNITNNTLVVAPGQTITATVTFAPQQYGITQTQLNLLSNDYDEPISTVTLSAHNLGRPFEIQPNTSYVFYDADDDLVEIHLTDGRAVLYLNNGLWTGDDIDTLMLYDTTPNSELEISVRGGQTTIGSIDSENSLSSIDSPKVTLNTRLNIDGSLDELLLNNVADGAMIHVAQYSSKPMTVQAEKIGQNVTFDLASNVKTFQASTYAGGALNAPQMDLLKITNGSLGANVNLSSGSLKKLDVYNNINGNVDAFDSIGKATSKTGGIFGSLTAQTGSIDNVTAKKSITGNLFAWKDIDKILAKKGTFSSTVRAENVNKITAHNINGALVSTADDIGKVTSKKDVRDSFFLAGYDIGMSLADSTDDSLSAGSVGKFKFSKVLADTFVAAGTMTDNIYIGLGLPLPSVQPPNGAAGSINISGSQVNTDPGDPAFGFFAVGSISTNLTPQDNFIIAPNL